MYKIIYTSFSPTSYIIQTITISGVMKKLYANCFNRRFLICFVNNSKYFCLTLLQVVYSKYTDLLPKEVLREDVPELQKPDEEAIKEVRYSVSVYFWGNVQIVVRSTYLWLYIYFSI